MRGKSWWVLAAALPLLVACGGGNGDSGARDATTFDWGAPDAVVDPGADAPPDPAPDVASEPGNPDPTPPDAPAPPEASHVETSDVEASDLARDPAGTDAVEPCGDGTCQADESCATCPDDCGPCPWCGDGDCLAPEDCTSCAADCGDCLPACGDGDCTGDETCAECPADCGECPATCPDGECVDEDCHTCAADCGACPTCGDGECNGDEACDTCALDCDACAPACPDGACNGDETCTSCADDCGACPACPDGACNGGESCTSCVDDCGPCQPWCGDQACNGAEDCATCPGDCGGCALDCGGGGCTAGETCDNCPADCGTCPPTVTFTGYWTETLSAPIVQGRKLRLRYDGARLPNCRGWKYGMPAWSLLVYVSFDLAGPATYYPVFEKSPVTGDMQPVEPVLDVPADATDVWFWATNNDAFGCSEWDSDYGKNYQFPVLSEATVRQDLPWAGQVSFIKVFDGGYQALGDVDPAFYWSSMGGSEIATYVQVEAYAPGITDRVFQDENVTREVANTALRALRRSDAYPGGQPGAPLKDVPLEYWARAGNNFVYRWFPAALVYNVDPQHVPDGAYRYRFDLATAEGAAHVSIGRPGANDQDRTMVLSQHQDCALFPYNPPAGWCP